MSDGRQTADFDRLDQIIDLITHLAAGELSARLPISDAGDQFDAIITGLNMLAEELSAAIDSERRMRESLEQQVNERTEELQQNLEKIKQQSRTILELSTPVLRIWDEILVLPLIGAVDTARAQQIVNQLLASVVENKAAVVILDITGVPFVDSAVAHHFLKTIEAVRLLGARVILTGVSPANAMTLVRLGIDLKQVQTKGTLQQGLQLALKATNPHR